MSHLDRRPEQDEYAFLRDPVLTERSRRTDAEMAQARLDERRRARRIRRNAAIGVLVAVIIAAVVATAVTGLSQREDRTAGVKIHTTPPSSAARLVLESPVPPAQGAPFPIGPVASAGVLRHSGGPYISRARIRAKVLAQLQCMLGKARRDMPGFTCARIDVAFFQEYADAWELRGASWAFVHAWGADREMYAVTVWGHRQSDGARVGVEPTLTEITTLEIDATTGRTMMEGGPPLPAADANR